LIYLLLTSIACAWTDVGKGEPDKKQEAVMSKQYTYMMVHNAPESTCEEVQNNWRKMARVENATWIRTYFNEDKGIRYCLWMAPSEETLKNIFTEIGVSWESIVQVEETTPDMWGEKWDEHVREEATASTLGN